MKKITSSDVAKMAGVSQSTVSFVLNNRTDISISERTRERVLEAARLLHYVPGTFPNVSDKVSSKTIGLIVPNFSNPYYPMLVQSVKAHITANGYNMLVCETDRHEPDERYYLRFFETNGVDGIIYGFTPFDYSYVNAYAKKLPIVILGETDERYKLHAIELDSAVSGALVARHLIDLGHKRIAFMTTPTERISLSRKKRLSGVREMINQSGSDYELIVRTADYEKEFSDSAYETEVGYELATRLLTSQKVTAIIGVNDMMAYGAIRAAADQGISVPEDLSVCGFDNLYLSRIVTPAITTVDHLISQRCKSAVSLIVDMIEKRNDAVFKMLYEPVLVVRDSTAQAKI